MRVLHASDKLLEAYLGFSCLGASYGLTKYWEDE
jgi:hypothetical protein